MGAGRSLLFAAGLVLSGCHPAPASSEPSEPSAPRAEATRPAEATAPEPPVRYVLLRESAMLASGLDQTADTAQALDPHVAGSARSLVWIMRLVDVHGPWFEVETLETAPDDVHCVAPLRGFDGYRLRLFVRVQDVATVTRREVTVELDNGNRVTLGPGVRVSADPQGSEPVRVHTFPELRLSIPADAIGHEYSDPRHYDTGESVGTLSPPVLRLSDELRMPSHVGVRVFAREGDGESTMATLAKECMRYEVRVPTSTIGPAQAAEVGGLGLRGSSPARYRIAAAAPIYWTNGERAGDTRAEVLRYDEPARREVGRVCFSHRVTGGRRIQSVDSELTLCFDTADVQAIEPSPAAAGS